MKLAAASTNANNQLSYLKQMAMVSIFVKILVCIFYGIHRKKNPKKIDWLLFKRDDFGLNLFNELKDKRRKEKINYLFFNKDDFSLNFFKEF